MLAQIIDFAGKGVVGAVGYLEPCALQGFPGDTVDFPDQQRRLGVVLELHDSKFVGE